MELMGLERVLGVYLHYPFCTQICPYCAFNQYAASGSSQSLSASTVVEGFIRQTGAVLRTVMKDSWIPTRVPTLYFGGGSPSLIPPKLVSETVSAIQNECQSLGISNALTAEITLEMNPLDALSIPNLRDLKSAGVSRISLGIQSLDASVLQVLGRQHSPENAIQAVENCCQVFGEGHVSVDFILATRPILHQHLTATTSLRKEHRWSFEEEYEALDYALQRIPRIGHASLYELTIERGTPFHQRGLAPLHTDIAANILEQSAKIMQSHGFVQYEVGSWVRKGSGTCAVHNSMYWAPWISQPALAELLKGNVPNAVEKSWTSGSSFKDDLAWAGYIGVGPGAHGRLPVRLGSSSLLMNQPVRISTVEIREPRQWLNAVMNSSKEELEKVYLDAMRSLSHSSSVSSRVEGDRPSAVRVGGIGRMTRLSDIDSVAEYVGAALRTLRGIDLQSLYRVFNPIVGDQAPVLTAEQLNVTFDDVVKEGLIVPFEQNQQAVLRASPKGLSVADSLYEHVFDRIVQTCNIPSS